jgi:transposase
MQFGRKSEKLDRQIEQLELRLEGLEADEGVTPVEIPKAPSTAPVHYVVSGTSHCRE